MTDSFTPPAQIGAWVIRQETAPDGEHLLVADLPGADKTVTTKYAHDNHQLALAHLAGVAWGETFPDQLQALGDNAAAKWYRVVEWSGLGLPMLAPPGVVSV